MKTINTIMLRRKKSIIVPEGYLLEVPSSNTSLDYMLTIAHELKSLGFGITPELAATLLRLNPVHLKDFYDEIIEVLKELIGADVEYNPMYKGFPESVIAKSDAELLLDQLFGYTLDFHSYLRDCFLGKDEVSNLRDHFEFDEKKNTVPLDCSNMRNTVLRLATMEDAHKMFEALMAQPEAYSKQDEEDLEWYFKNCTPFVKDHIPEVIPNKENLTLIISLAQKHNIETVHKFKTATDVLRYAVKLSDGDTSLASSCRFKHFTRSEARSMLDSLENMSFSYLEEDIMRRPEEFKRLFEGIHLGSERYTKRYPKVYAVMQRVYERDTNESFRGKVERYLLNGEVECAAKLLTHRPGELARALDRLLRMAEDDTQRLNIIELFSSKTAEIPTKLLWDMVKHFKNRRECAPRIAMIKNKNVFVPKRLEEFTEKDQFSAKVYNKLQEVLMKGITDQYAKRKQMKCVFVDEQLKSYLMPTANRSTQSASKPLTRGTKMKVESSTDIIRLFLYWKGKDVDLSVVLADKDFEKVSCISWQNSFRSPYFKPQDVVHSGDITYAKEGAAEFLDLNIKEMKKSMPTIKYAIMYVFSYSGVPFNKMEKCYAGVMEREKMGKRLYSRTEVDKCQGEIYEAKTVQVKANLSASSVAVIPLVYDFDTNEVIWLDVPSGCHDVEANKETVMKAKDAIDYFSVQRKPNIYEVVLANVVAREGTLVERCTIMDVDNKEYIVWCKTGTNELLEISDDEVTVFGLDEGITPFDMEVLLTEYL